MYPFEASKKPIYIDIGANVGNHGIYLAKKCFKIIGYEPEKRL